MPSFMKTTNYHPIKDIDFTSGQGKKRKLDKAIDRDDVELESKITADTHGDVPTDAEMDLLLIILVLGHTTCSVLFTTRLF